jgi:short-subunit dehydrogenase
VINIGSEAGVAIVPGRAAYCVSKHALRALTEVIQDANHDNGIKAWVICPGFVDTDVGEVVPGTNPLNFLRVGEVVDVARYLIRLDYNVKLGPEILIRTMRNAMTTSPAVISGTGLFRQACGLPRPAGTTLPRIPPPPSESRGCGSPRP